MQPLTIEVSSEVFRFVPKKSGNLPDDSASMTTAATFLLAVSLFIIDGDTFDLAGERIRIANVDAPEVHEAKCQEESELGRAAGERLRELLKGRRIIVHRGDPDTGRLKDKHGRTLATIEVDGRDVGDVLVKEGYARRWTGRREPWCD
jgi:micrococcal nuclease